MGSETLVQHAGCANATAHSVRRASSARRCDERLAETAEGVRLSTTVDATEASATLREATRVAREHKQTSGVVTVWRPLRTRGWMTRVSGGGASPPSSTAAHAVATPSSFHLQ